MIDPTTVLQQLLNAGALTPQAFGPQSRYCGLPILTMPYPQGSPPTAPMGPMGPTAPQISYVSRRFIPQPSSYSLLQRYRVKQGDRVDVVAGAILGDPLMYWQICDANLALDPDDVTAVPGAFIAITLPAGTPGGVTAMYQGVNLTLMIGPGVPVPVSQGVLEAVDKVQVISRDGTPLKRDDGTVTASTSAFELTFKISVNSPLQTLFLLAGGVNIPLVRVVIAVTVSGQTSVLIDGVMTDHSVSPDVKDGTTTLSIKGEDLCRVMDYIDFSGFPFPAMPREAQVAVCVAKYAMFGLIPMIVPSVLLDVPIPVEEIPVQQGTDLEHVCRLADMVGYVFYMEPGPAVGTSVAYWGPQIKVGPVQPALGIDTDASSNVESLSFSFSNQRTSLPILVIQEPITKAPIPIPIPDINPLAPPLGAVGSIPMEYPIISGSAKLPPIRAALIGLAKSAQAADHNVTANGTLDVLRYGQVLAPRKLVGLRGAGTAFDGLWYVSSVTHNLRRGEYKQDFTLSRNGLVSTLPSVAL